VIGRGAVKGAVGTDRFADRTLTVGLEGRGGSTASIGVYESRVKRLSTDFKATESRTWIGKKKMDFWGEKNYLADRRAGMGASGVVRVKRAQIPSMD